MEEGRFLGVVWIAVLISVFAFGASATPVAAQGTVTIDAPQEVQPDGGFDFTVDMNNSSVGEVAVESSDFAVNLTVLDADGDSRGSQTNTSIEFIDIDADNSTYTLNADITGGSEGETGTITAVTGADIGNPEVDDEATATFSIVPDGGDDGSGDGQEADGTDDEADNEGQGEGLPGFTLLTGLLALVLVVLISKGW